MGNSSFGGYADSLDWRHDRGVGSLCFWDTTQKVASFAFIWYNDIWVDCVGHNRVFLTYIKNEKIGYRKFENEFAVC